MKIISH